MKYWLGTVARLVVGVVVFWAGAVKITGPAASAASVHAYQLSFIPSGLQDNIGYLLPPLELVVGLALILGVMTRGAAIVSAVLMVLYVAAIASVWARGITIDCGCFGGGGYDPDAASHYPWEIARDVGLAVLAGFVVWLGHTRLALDSVIFRRPSQPREHLDELGADELDDETDLAPAEKD